MTLAGKEERMIDTKPHTLAGITTYELRLTGGQVCYLRELLQTRPIPPLMCRLLDQLEQVAREFALRG